MPVLAGKIKITPNLKLQLNNLTSNTAYLLQMYRFLGSNMTLVYNQTHKTPPYKSRPQRFDYKSECKIDVDKKIVNFSVDSNRTSNIHVEFLRESNTSFEVFQTPCASQCNFSLSTDFVFGDRFNIMMNFDKAAVVLSRCEVINNRTPVPMKSTVASIAKKRLEEPKILSCKRLSESSIQLKVLQNMSSTHNRSYDLWFRVEYKYLNDLGYKTVEVKKESDLQVRV
jgi:hypothetical protein